MAEVFAAASAAIGIVAATGQLIDGIVKLNTFCKDIRDIPDDIQNVVEDLVSLHEVLDSIQAEMCQGGPVDRVDPRSSAKVLANLKQSSRQVDEVLKEMQQKLGKKRYWGRVKAIGMRRKLEKAVFRTRSAQSLMLMMLTTDCRMLIRQGFDAQKDGFAAISSLVTTAINTHQASDHEMGCSMVTVDAQRLCLTEEKTSVEDAASALPRRKSRARLIKSRTIRLNWPTWLLSQAWELDIRRAARGWDFSIRSYRIVPFDADIFLAIEQQDLDKVRQLLSNGEASKWDRSPHGLTVLHVAAKFCSDSENGLAIFELFANIGADINAISFAGTSVQQTLPMYANPYTNSSAKLRIVKAYRICISHPDWITQLFLRNSGKTCIESTIYDLCPSAPPEAVHLALNQIWPPWNDMILSHRLESLLPWEERFAWAASPLCIRACLGHPDVFRNSIAQCDVGKKKALVHYTLLALSFFQSVGLCKDAEEARRILKDIFSADSIFLHSAETWEVQPVLLGFIEIYCFGKLLLYKIRYRISADFRLSKMMSRVEEGLKCFLSEMALLEVDRLSPFEAQMKHRGRAILEPGTCLSVDHVAREGWEIYSNIRIIRLDSGLGADNWQLWLSNPLDEWAGEFWDMIEHPERRIPGAWDESYDSL